MDSLKLLKNAKRAIKNLRKKYKTAVKIRKDIYDEWLKDNFYILERETFISINTLKSYKINLQKIIPLCENFIETKGENLDAVLQKNGEFYTAEILECLPHVIRLLCVIKCEEDKKYLPFTVKTFRSLNPAFCDELVEKYCVIDHIFNSDETFAKMDDATKSYYRSQCAKGAKKNKISQKDHAENILKKAKEMDLHIGNIFLEDTKEDFTLKIRGGFFLYCRLVLPLIFSVIFSICFKNFFVGILLYIPLHEILRHPLQWIFMLKVNPRFVPRMNIKKHLPKDARTLITISGLVPKTQEVESICKHLEEIYFANPQSEVGICYLADLKESEVPYLPSDEREITALIRGIKNLNKKHKDKFFLAVRPRVYIKTQNAYAGFERKRGAIMELCELIYEDKNRFSHFVGDMEWIKNAKYIYALDSDTKLPQDGVLEMASAALHPLNKPHVKNGIVTKGHALFVPPVSVGLFDTEKTYFGSIMNGRGGNSAYNSPCSNLYFDLLGESIFAGKGYFEIDTFYTLLKDAFPKERVLSHDILEGGYLRPAFCSFTEVTDGCPKNSKGWFNRLGRWIRGDFQNSLFMKKYIPTKKGRVKNPLPLTSRLFLLDNLIRQICPFISASLLILGAFCPPIRLTFCILSILSITIGDLLSFARLFIKRGSSALTRRYHSGLLPDASLDILRAVFSVMMLINTGIVSGISAFLGLFRQYISRKNLLSWTTAADADIISKGTLFSFIASGYYGISVGVLFIAFAPFILKILGALFIISPLILYLSSKPKRSEKINLTDEQRDKISNYIVLMWNFYDHTVTKRNNFLPPDNMSVAPSSQTANRTSPTNIGLYLLSAFCAMKQGIISTDELLLRIQNCLDTLDKLEKWKGHFLNWYNTENLSSLTPKYCSAVDSGNMICCLYALINGIKSLPEFKDVSARIEDILNNTDFSVFYNENRKLFHIGYDLEKDELTDGYYDMLMSEARMTVYYAVAKGQVPKDAFTNLSRILTAEKGYIGPASWTGTAFEYLMPPLLLPTYKGSLGYEGIKYCIFCGKNRAKELGLPFGCSESGFYSFDGRLNYQYKAHGIQRLGLKRGLNKEYVVSPYSSFLALPFCPNFALNNLERLKNIGAFYKYGFYEAVDYTESRRGNAPFNIVQSYMAHHVGMSICGAFNALTNFGLCNIFMQDEMLSAKELLCEKIPVGAKIYNHFVEQNNDKKPAKLNIPAERFENISPINPTAHLLCNGNMSLVLYDNGCSVNAFEGKRLYGGFGDLIRNPQGVFAVATVGRKRFFLTPVLKDNLSRQVQISSQYVSYFCKNKTTEWGMAVSLHKKLPCEMRKIRVKNTITKAQSIRLLFYLEPQLSTHREFSSHPAFNRLFIMTDYDRENKIIFFEKRSRNTGEISDVLGVGLDKDLDFEFDTRRENVIKKGSVVKSLLSRIKLENQSSGVPDPCLAMRIKMRLNPKSTKEVGFIICHGKTKQSVIANICYCRREKNDGIKGASSPFYLGSLEGRIAQKLLPRLYSPLGYKQHHKESFCVNSLWKIGVSGDRPIVTVHVKDEDSVKNLNPLLGMYGILRGCSIEYDLCVIYNNGGDYFDRLHNALLKCADENNALSYINDGIYFLEEHSMSKDTKTALEQVACCKAEELFSNRQKTEKYTEIDLISAKPNEDLTEEETLYLNGGHNHLKRTENPLLSLKVGDFYEDSFLLKETPSLPFCNVMANKDLGSVVSNNALGFTYYKNSSENLLTPFFNDTRFDNKGEMLIMKIGEKYYDMIDGSRVIYSKNSTLYKGIIEDAVYTVRVWVEDNSKKIAVSFSTVPKNDCKIAFYCQPVLASTPSKQGGIKTFVKDKGVIFHNSLNDFADTYMAVGCNRNYEICLDKGSFWQGKWQGNTEKISKDTCCALITNVGDMENNDILFILTAREEIGVAEETLISCFERNRELIKKSHHTFLKDAFPTKTTAPKIEKSPQNNIIQINTPHKELDVMFNTWLPIQMENSRFLARCGFYQSAGGYGFRDQLQDVCGILLFNPTLAREHILRCCGVQFEEGDVLHWWHEKKDGISGVRTRCSDDMLWLPYTLFEYIEKTGDTDILKVEIPYIFGETLKENEQERYFIPQKSQQKGTVYDHALRAINKIEYAKNGLLKIGSCDWNDGFSAIGEKGEGSSVWLSQFYAIVARKMAKISRFMKDEKMVAELEKRANDLLFRVDEICYDGQWYLRAFFDNGEPLGSHKNKEAKIDLLPQSFAVLSNMQNKDRLSSSIDSCMKHLVDDENGIIRLFTPPLKETNAGYISSYPEGIRENGGQYTHGALWLVKALFRLGRKEEGYRLLQYINPAYRYLQGEWGYTLKTEPYALPADIYYGKNYTGRGGWSHYTGAAAWYYRIVLEELLGIKIFGDRVEITPNIPKEWDGFSALLNIKNTQIDLKVKNADNILKQTIYLDQKNHSIQI